MIIIQRQREIVLEKVKAHVGDVDFAVQPEILSLLSSGNFGRYADEKGEMKGVLHL